MKKLFIIALIIGCFTIIGCKKEGLLGNLDLNKWEQQNISNYIIVDSSYAVPVSPSFGDVWIYMSFNQSSIEQEWTNIKALHVIYQKYSFNAPWGNVWYNTVPYNNGKATFAPNNTENNTNYRFQFYIEFNNGRTTDLSPTYSITTPPF